MPTLVGMQSDPVLACLAEFGSNSGSSELPGPAAGASPGPIEYSDSPLHDSRKSAGASGLRGLPIPAVMQKARPGAPERRELETVASLR